MNIVLLTKKKMARDRFVLSKGSTAPRYYAALANRSFPVEDLKTLRKVGSYLQGPDMGNIFRWIAMKQFLGRGISAAVGMAISGKLRKKDYRVYTLLGDGEIQEGQVWEAAMLAAPQPG